jgi:hypothetical protein
MCNDCYNLIQFIGTNAVKAYDEEPFDTIPSDFLELFKKGDNYVKFYIYSRWRPEPDMWLKLSDKYQIAIINDFEIECGLEGIGHFACEDGVEIVSVEYTLNHKAEHFTIHKESENDNQK